MKLSPRLLYISSFISNDMIIADIGSDHGFLPYYLLENKIIKKAYACDNKIGPFNNLKNTFQNKFENQIEINLSDGLKNVPNYVNTIIMAGMGGDLIINLLKRDSIKLKNISYLVLSPQSNIPLVREYIINNGFQIIDEGLVIDDNIYSVIKCIKGNQQLNEKELYFGPILLKNKNEIFFKLYKKRIDEINNILTKNISKERCQELNNELNLIKGEINEF